MLANRIQFWEDPRLHSKRRQRRGRWVRSTLRPIQRFERHYALRLPLVDRIFHRPKAKPLPVSLRLSCSANFALLARMQADPMGVEAEQFKQRLRKATTRGQYKFLLARYRLEATVA